MRLRIAGVALTIGLFLTACGGHKDEKFSEKFGEVLCDAYAECGPEVECETNALGDFDVSDCEYDKDAAKECLDGEFVCNSDFGDGFEYVEVPEICSAVFTDCDDPL